jgi:hypothetical protein
MSITCPKCNGEDTQKVSLFFESAVRATVAATTSQPALLEAAAPPKKGSYFHIFECWFIGTMVMDLVASMCGWPKALGQSLISAILIACIYAGVRAYIYNRNDWPPLYAKWQQSYICLKCSNIFETGGRGREARRDL